MADTQQLPSYAIPGPYVTSLLPDDEARFRKWVIENKIPSDDASGKPDPTFSSKNQTYDMRGFWKANQSGKAQRAANLHFPDTYKTPYHKTFSNESKYATKDAPHWVGETLVDKNGKVVFDETPKKNNTQQTDKPYGLTLQQPTIQEFLEKVYSNPKYAALPDDKKKEFDSKTYDKFVLPYYQRIAKRDAPDKESWLRTPASERSKIQDPIKAGELASYAESSLFRATRGMEKIGKNLTDLAFKGFELTPEGQKDSYHLLNSHIDKWFDEKIGQEDKKIHDTDTIAQIRSHDPVKKAIDFASDHAMDLALFKGLGAVGGAIKGATISQQLATNPVGKFVLKAGIDAAEGYTAGYGLTGKESEAEGWAKFGGAIGTAGAGKEIIDESWRAKKYFSNILSFFGADFLAASLKKTASMMEGTESIGKVALKTNDVNDPLVRKLTTANQAIYNDYAKRMYPSKSGYTALNKNEKDDVLKTIFTDIKTAGKNLPAYSKNANLYAIETTNAKVMKEPVARQSVQQLRAVTKKLTGSGDFNAAAEQEQIKAIQKVVKTEPAKKLVPKQQLKFGPGAASKADPSFTEEAFMRYLSTNPYVEGDNFRDTIEYWRATNGKIPNPKLAQKIKDTYEVTNPDPNERAKMEQNALEHLTKLYKTGHRFDTKSGNVYRSTELSGKPTKWQKQLHKEYKQVIKKESN